MFAFAAWAGRPTYGDAASVPSGSHYIEMGISYALGPGITTLEIPGAQQSRYRGDRSSHPVC